MSGDIFDRRARRARALRAVPGGHDFLHTALAEGIADRLTGVRRNFARVLDIGGRVAPLLPPGAAGPAVTMSLAATPRHAGERQHPQPGEAATLSSCTAVGAGVRQHDARWLAVVGEEDRLPFADAGFDLVVSAGVLQTVGDLPGALILARRVLAPDGLFMASLFGGGTLSELRADLLAAESDLTGRAAARVAPMVDAAEAGALLNRAGFALPVVDTDRLTVRYDHLFAALADLHGAGGGNVLSGRAPLRRDVLADAARRFGARAGPDGRIAVAVDVITLTGWAPAPSQPQPLARGSGKISLAAALRSSI